MSTSAAIEVEFPVSFEGAPADVRGALYLPDAPGVHPGLVVIPDVRGLYAHYHDVARRVAAQGFATLALDIYSREGAPELPDMAAVSEWIRTLPDLRVLADVEAAIAFLAARPEVAGRKVGLTGFCMGGKYAFLAAARCRGLSAVVGWYGMLRNPERDAANPEDALDALGELEIPLLGLFGQDDPIVPRSDVEALEQLGRTRPCPVEVVVYPGAGHAFANDSRPEAYRADAAADGWRRAFEFLHRHLD
ncbi:MAG: dienelactone hydrolase family protein [Myxococcota bacterium]